MKIAFFISMLFAWLFLVVYTVVRGAQSFSVYPALRTVFVISMVVSFLAFIGGMFFGNYLPAALAKSISFIGYSFLLFTIYLFFSFLLIDIIRIINHFTHFTADIGQFRFLITTVFMGIILLVFIVGNVKFNYPQVVNLEVQSSKPKIGKEITLVGISDVHLGISQNKKNLDKYVRMINAQNPDLVLIAGDLIDRSIKPVLAQKMDEELRRINAPMGVYASLGNHEYFGEGEQVVSDFFQKSNIKLLKDSAALVGDQLYIVGRRDYIDPKRQKIDTVFNGINHSKPVILLDHQPYNLQDAEGQNVDFQLSGHSHNGQFFPGNLIVKKIFEKGYGFLKKGNTNYYISSGLGIWGPQYRIGTQSELVVVKFRY